MEMLAVALAVAVNLVVAITAGIVASNRGRSVEGWSVLCFLLPLAIIILLALPDLKAQQEQLDTKLCPQCSEAVKQTAKVCRYCGHGFPEKAGLTWGLGRSA